MISQIFTAVRATWRNFTKNLAYGSLNVIGLSLAFASVILLGCYVYQEYSYEEFHENSDRIYRATHRITGQNDFELHFARVPVNFINELPHHVPEIEKLIRFQNKEQKYLRIGNERFKPKHAYVTDTDVFEVFSYPLLLGSQADALAQPHSIVLTEKIAQQYFGRTDVMGEEIAVVGDLSAEEQVYQVTGVMEEVPSTTHLPVEMFFSFANEEERSGWAYVYTLLSEGASIDQVEEKMPSFIDEHTDNQGNNEISFVFQSLGDIHLTSDLAREIQPNGRKSYVNLFFWVGFFLWLVALINFTNLSAALAMRRTKEVGVRRILGAGKNQVAFFAIVESTVFATAAMAIGGLVAYLVFPYISNLMSITVLPAMGTMISLAFLLAVLSGVIAGLVPASFLRKLKAVQLLKKGEGAFRSSGRGGFSLKRSLITVQFCVTIILFCCAIIAHKQFSYVQEKDLGINTEQILTMSDVPSLVTEKYQVFNDRLESLPGVKTVAACMQMPSSEIRDLGPVRVFGRDEAVENPPMMDMQIVDPEFLQMMDLQLAAGTDFRTQLQPVPEFTEAYTMENYLEEDGRKYMINETAMRQLGFDDPEEAVGQQVNWSIGHFDLAYGPIVGVIKDYHQESLRNQVDPLIMTVEPLWFGNVLVKVDVDQLESTLPQIQGIWQEMFPYAFEYSFLDELFARLYQQDRKQLSLLSALTFLAVFISLLGLAGLVAFALQSRAKELAIRRVIGASLRSLGGLMGKEYFWVLLVSCLVAVPVSHHLISGWLENFAYHISISPAWYLLVIATICSLVMGIIFLQTWRSTTANPMESLQED